MNEKRVDVIVTRSAITSLVKSWLTQADRDADTNNSAHHDHVKKRTERSSSSSSSSSHGSNSSSRRRRATQHISTVRRHTNEAVLLKALPPRFFIVFALSGAPLGIRLTGLTDLTCFLWMLFVVFPVLQSWIGR